MIYEAQANEKMRNLKRVGGHPKSIKRKSLESYTFTARSMILMITMMSRQIAEAQMIQHQVNSHQAQQHAQYMRFAPQNMQIDPMSANRQTRQVLVPGSEPPKQLRDKMITEVVLPFDGYAKPNASGGSYVIDHKRYVEAVNSRCFASTILENPSQVEPNFVIIKPNGETRLNATAPVELIMRAGFEPHKGTTIIVHGFTQSYPDTAWLRHTRALFEKHALIGRHNLIIMDWGLGSHGSYGQVAGRASGMGSFLSNFLIKLIDLGADRMKMHLIGHSLGAHVAGFAGKRIRPKIGRITALDPAGPCFGKFFSNSPNDRLGPDDAIEVDVYHYDDSFLGLPGQHGQFDVYVNGGSSQPGCKDNVYSMFDAVITVVFGRNRVLSESHTRSTEVATSQLSISECQQIAYECRDFDTFLAGECGKCDDDNNQCFFMGFPYQYSNPDPRMFTIRSSYPGKKFYILTGLNEKFCALHYQILIKFEPTPDMINLAKRNKWKLKLDLINDSRAHVDVTVTNQMTPNVFSYLLLADVRPMRIVAAHLRVLNSDNSQVPLLSPTVNELRGHSPKLSLPMKVLKIEVNFMSHIDPHLRRRFSSRLCPTGWVDNGKQVNSIADSSSEMALKLEECLAP